MYATIDRPATALADALAYYEVQIADDAPTIEDAQAWAESTRDEPAAWEVAAEEAWDARMAEFDAYADSLACPFEEAELSEMGTQLGHMTEGW